MRSLRTFFCLTPFLSVKGTDPAAPAISKNADEIRTRLQDQNEQGRIFFNMDENGLPVSDGMDDVLDLFLMMDPDDLDSMNEQDSSDLYVPFQSAVVTSEGNERDILLNLPSVGKIRPLGGSSLAHSTCLNISAIPLEIWWSSSSESQTLFGVEKSYLRNHYQDPSFLREWAFHRMLARFGLPHLRIRTVRFFVNDEFVGLYDLMEAVDQEYVFHRSFPEYDMENFAMYEVRSASVGCGEYSDDAMEQARERIDETSTPPYSFERGYRAVYNSEECEGKNRREHNDAALAYLRSGNDCGEMLMENDLFHRSLGVEDWDPVMEAFINQHLHNTSCHEGCNDSDFSAQLDISNVIKTLVFHAALLNLDSPLGNGMNYLWAQSGDGKGWKVITHHMDKLTGYKELCHESCPLKLIYWSIQRPTCQSLEDHPLTSLLTNPMLHQQYLLHMKDFIDNVMTDSLLIDQINSHAHALQYHVYADPWYFGDGKVYTLQLSTDPNDWSASFGGRDLFPFVPFIKARAEQIRLQLDVLEEGKTMLGVELNETCVDWRTVDYQPDPPPKIEGDVSDESLQTKISTTVPNNADSLEDGKSDGLSPKDIVVVSADAPQSKISSLESEASDAVQKNSGTTFMTIFIGSIISKLLL